MPAARSTAPTVRRHLRPLSARATSSRIAATGGTLPGPSRRQVGGRQRDEHADDEAHDDRARLEHQRVLAEVEPEPPEDRLDADGEQHAEADPDRRARRVRPRPASSSTDRATWRRLAPIARSRASSRLRWATRIEKVLTIRKAPTVRAMPAKTSRKVVTNDSASSIRLAARAAVASPVAAWVSFGQHLGDGGEQLLLAGAGGRRHPHLREGVVALEEQLLRLARCRT